MNVLTSALFGALLVYGGGWYAGYWLGNFSLLLFILALVTGLYWLAEQFYFRPQREGAAEALLANDAKRREALAAQGIAAPIEGQLEQAREAVLRQPWWLDWTAGLFPVLLIVFLLRSFLFEPFKIPSGSMVPTLLVGDLILVNKYHYGVRLPVINKKILDNEPVRRGDVVVFRFPEDTRLDYIKRAVGLPGDTVQYVNQQLYVNGKLVLAQTQGQYYDEDSMRYRARFTEKLGDREHQMLVQPDFRPTITPSSMFPHSDHCKYSVDGVTCTVPPGHYFMMGDNRDNSLDSRFWGFVPDENIVGRAFMVWMNFSDIKRVGVIN
ncbi:signal peptidase I [Roseateles sp. BYS180W]|uniref:Signal peptidase I n=1 Tax=Roseateles rivi TaxID=3299028 RepID=A0ABW7FSA2_9BURK